MSEPCDVTAREARRLIGAKALSPVELMESCLARIAAVNGPLNAIVACDEELARDGAREAEARVMAGGPLGALHGLPLALKDSRHANGLPTTFGSLLDAGGPMREDDPGAARLRAAGAVLFAKTNLPEYGAGANTKNRLFGPTQNPFDLSRTAAGSSGGSAVALAAGMVPLATGSDYGGSLRTPAGYCGVVGFRPSLGVVPVTEGLVLSPFQANGPMARTIADAHLLLCAEAAPDRRDPFSSAAGMPDAALAVADTGAMRIAVSPDLGAAPVSREVRALFAERIARLSPHLGAVEETAPDFGPHVHDVFEITRGIHMLAAHQEKVERHRDRLDRNVVDNCDRALRYGAADVAFAVREQAALYRRVLAFFEDVDVLIAPAASVQPFPHAALFPSHVDGEEMPTYMRWLAIAYMPTLAFCTAAVVPAGVDGAGLPFGLQIIGPPGRDGRVLSAALALETLLADGAETRRPVPDLAALSSAPHAARP